MPGERPRGAPPPTMTGDLQPGLAVGGLGRPPQPLITPGSRTTHGPSEAGGRAQAQELPEARPRPAKEVEPKALLLRTQAAPRRSHPQAHRWVVGRADGSPPELYCLSVTSARAKPTPDETPEGPQREAPRGPEAEGPGDPGAGAHPRPSLPRAEAPPAPQEHNSPRCFQETPSGFTSTDYTSPKATPGPLPLRAPQGSGPRPQGPAPHPELPASGADAWPRAAADHFPGADFSVPPQEPEPLPGGSRPGGPQGGSFQFPFPSQTPPGAGAKPFPTDTASHQCADRGLLFAFRQPSGPWQEAGVGTAAYPLPAQPALCTLPCYPSQPGGPDDPRDPGGARPVTGATHLAPSPLPDTLHKSLSRVLPDGAPLARDGMASPRALPDPLSRRPFPGQAQGANGVGASPEPVDSELTAPGPPPTGLPHLWDPTAAPYPTRALGLADTARATFLEGHSGPGQGLCLPQSSPVPWPQVLPPPGPSPHPMEILSQLPCPRGTPEWQGDGQAGLSAACQTARTGEALAGVRGSAGQPGSSPGLLPYRGLGDPGPQPLLFGGAQAQASPRGASLEPAKAFPFPTDRLGAEGPGAGRGLLQGFPREPPPYPGQHFSLSSASLDQLDVLLTCRQCDRNYGSLAGFLAHRHFCRPARAGDGSQQPPGHPAPTTTPQAPAHMHTGPLSHGQTVPFLIARDDPLRTSYLPSLATPFPLPASDLDLEDEAKLDSLITEALNGLEGQSDNPEIDSSFIDVFADEEPSGPRGPGPGPPTNNGSGATPEHSAEDLLPAKADPPESRAPCPGDRSCPPGNRPKTRSLGLVPTEADAISLVKPQRRGKRFKLLRKELDIASGPKGPCLRPRRRGHSTERPPPRTRDLRTPARGHTDPDSRAPGATSLTAETRSSRRLRLPAKKDPRKRRARGGTWSKELIHKMVQQKSQLPRRQAPRGAPGPPRTQRALPRAQDSRLRECDSESEEECPRQRGASSRGRSCPGPRRWQGGEKREEDPPRGPRKGQRPEARKDRGTPAAGGPCSPSGSPDAGEAAVEHGLEHTDSPWAPPNHRPQLPANSKGPEEDQLPSDFPQEAQGPAAAQESAPEATGLRDGPSLSPAICEGEGARPPAPEPTQPGRPWPPGSQARERSSQSTAAPGPGDCPADRPGGLPRPVSAHPEPHVLLVQNVDAGCDPAGPDRDSVGGPPAGKEPHPSSSASTELLLRPRDLEGCLPGGLCSRPSAAHTQGASRGHLGPDSVDTLEPRPLQHSPDATDTPPGSAPSLLTLESTSLFAGLPEEGFDPPLGHGRSADGDAHTPMAPAGTPPRKPLMDPLCPPFLLLEEEVPMLPSQFPGLSGGMTLGKKCPHEAPVPPVPGKGSECSLGSLSEEELEIKRLVSELESQLQRTGDTQGAPGGPGEVPLANSVCPGPGPEPASTPGDTVSALDLMGLGESNVHQEAVETGPAAEDGARGGFQGEWPCPAPSHPGQAVPPPSTHEDPGSGAALGPPGGSLSSQAEQMARVSEKEGDGRDLSGQLEAMQSARRSPNQALLFPNETVRTQGTEDTPLWLPCEQSGGRSPEPPEAGGCSQGPPAWARGHPSIYLVPDLATQADGDLPPGACHRVIPEEHSGGRAGGPKVAGPLFPMTEGPGFEGKGAAPAPRGREPRDPHTPSPGWGPQAPASLGLRPLQVLEAGAGSNDSDQGSRRVLLAAAQGPPHRAPPGPGGPGGESGSPGCKQATADPAATGPQRAPQAEGHLGPPGQAEKPAGCGEASSLQPVSWREPGGPGSLARSSAHPANPLARPARGTPEPEESQAPLGLGTQAPPTPGPSSSSGTRSPPAPMAAHTQGPEDRGPGKVSSSGLDPQLLFNRESPAPHAGDLGTHDAASIAMATLAPCSLEPLPGEEPPSRPSSGPEDPGQTPGLLPAPTSCAQGQVGGASGVQAPPGARAREAPAALPSLTTSPCGPKEIPPGCPLLRAGSPQDPPCCRPELSAALTPTCKDYGAEVGPRRAPEGSQTEGLGRPPAHHRLAPPAGAISPAVTTQAAGPSSIPTEDGTEMGRGLWASDPHLSGATDTSPCSVSEGPSSEPPGNTPLLGHGEGESPLAVPTPPGATEPNPHAYLGGETGAGREGEGDPGTPGARHPGLRRAPRADPSGPARRPSPAGLCQAQAASSSSAACDLRSGSPPSSVPHLTPQKDPKQRGFRKNPEPTETGHQESHAPARPGLPVTCETCSASFRSRPGLNRHRARKHPPRKPATCQPSPGARRGPRKRSHKGPGGDPPSPSVRSPGRTPGPSPIQGSTVPEDTLGPETLEEARRSPGEPRTPGSPCDPLPHPPGPVGQGEGVRAPAPKPGRPGPPEVDQLPPQQTENREDQRRPAEPRGSPKPQGKGNRKVGKRGTGGASAGAGPGGCSASPVVAAANHAALPSCCLSREGACEASVGQWLRPATLGPEVLEDKADTGLGVLSAEMAPKSPRDQQLLPGKMEAGTEGVLPGELPAGWRGASARRCRGPRDIREPGSQPAEASRGARGRSGKRTGEGAPDPPKASDSVVGKTIRSGPRSRPGARAEGQGPQGTVPAARGPGPVDPPSSLDDDVSFAQLFPLGGRFTQEKNPRVYGKGCQRPPRPPPTEPRSQGGDLLHPTHLPPDLSDPGALCLSLQDPWEDEAVVLPEPFLLDGLLGSEVPSLDPWAPSLSLWAPEPHREAGPGEEAPSGCTEDAELEAIPKLHMVPAAWRGLSLRAPNDGTPPLGAESPEPPDLERERYDDGLPGSASLLPRHAQDLDMLGAKLEVQDLCFLGPRSDLAGLLSSSLLDSRAAADPQGPGSQGAPGAARPAQAGGRELPARGRRASYKCRVCFQRLCSLGELDVHKLAHSPSPPPTCYLCVERRFCSRQRLREHLQERHLQGRVGPWACGLCLKEVADVWMYNQHLREHAARFARRGQAQQPWGGLPRDLAPESTHTHLLDTVMEPVRPRSSRPTGDRASGSPRETSEGGREAEEETAREQVRPASGSSPAAPTGSSATHSAKTSPSLAPDPWPQRERLLPAVPMHAACRDPSRDCHHCGKRFPKPFKLQRHLAVHSPQRVYLCPRCPGVYPELCELRAHLGGVHGLQEERELPHTPLYACELCANVMHVIRRSFVCSSCNYTFAKKEQFDRHMEKHLRGSQQPLALRRVRRPATPRQKALALEGVLPSKRRKVVVPSSPPGLGVAVTGPLSGPLSLGSPTLSPPALPQLCPESAPSTTKSWPHPPSPAAREDQRPPHSQELPPPALSPLPTALAGGSCDQGPDPTLERPEDTAWPGEQQPPREEKRPPAPFSGGHRSPGVRSRCASDGSSEDRFPLQKKKQVSTPHVAPERGTRGPSHKGGATKPPKQGAAASTPSHAPKPLGPLRKPVGRGSPAPREQAQSTEDRVKPTSPKAKPRASSQGNRCPWPGTQTGGGSQPQPASGRLQSETASTPARPLHPGPNPASAKSPSRTQARGCTKGPREAGVQGPRGSPSPRETGREKRRKSQALEPAKREGVGGSGRAPVAPDKPLRTPRKQPAPSRVPPTKPRPSSQHGKMRPPPSEQREAHSRAHRGEALSKHSPQARLLLRAPKRGRAVHSAEAPRLRDHRTAESQSNLLNQLFGQRLTSFKIPLKKFTSE
uniref:zinc finger protein 469 n=1 Tax=Ictidomys tridecemlineatus TaxID=43179 RepID=UPI001A9F5E66|nr:zinc finger protein 469 [Ictidomys tridecemlineatus]